MKLIKWGYTILCLAFFVIACLLFLVGSLKYVDAKTLVDSHAADGYVETYTSAFHASLALKAKIFAIAFLIAGVILLAFRKFFLTILLPIAFSYKLLKDDLKLWLKYSWMGSSKWHIAVFLLIIFAGIAMRLLRIDTAVTYDEAFTYIYYAIKPVYVIISDYSYPNNQIFHTLLVKLSTTLFGNNHVGLRLPAFLAGVILLPVTYGFIRSIIDRYAALLVMGVIAVSPVMIEYSVLARGYSLICLFFILSLLLANYYSVTGNRAALVLLGGLLVIGMYTIPVMFYPAGMIFLWMIYQSIRTPGIMQENRIKNLVLTGILTGVFVLILYAPVIITYGIGQLFHHPTMEVSDWLGFIDNLPRKLAKISNYFFGNLGMAGAILFLFFTCAGFLAYATFRSYLLAALIFILPVVAFQRTLAPSRVWLFFYLLMLIIAVSGLYHIIFKTKWAKDNRKTLANLITMIILLVGSLFAYKYHPGRYRHFMEAEMVVLQLKEILQPGDRLLVYFPAEAPIKYYLRKHKVPLDYLFRDENQAKKTIAIFIPDWEQSPETLEFDVGGMQQEKKIGRTLIYTIK